MPGSYYTNDPLNGKLTSLTVTDASGAAVVSEAYSYSSRETKHYHGVNVINQRERFPSLVKTDASHWQTHVQNPDRAQFYANCQLLLLYALNTEELTLDHLSRTVDGVTTTTDFTYDRATMQLRSQSSTLSDGSKATQTLSYPTDFSFSPYTTLAARHIVSPVVEDRAMHGAVVASSALTTYRQDGSPVATFVDKALAQGSPPTFVGGQPNAALYDTVASRKATLWDARGNQLHVSMTATWT